MGAPALEVRPNPDEVLSKALINAGAELELSQAVIGRVVGRDRTSLKRPLNPASKSGELALLLIRVYRSLFALVGGNKEQMRHWMHTKNRHTGGVPADQILDPVGLVRVLNYLDAMRGR